MAFSTPEKRREWVANNKDKIRSYSKKYYNPKKKREYYDKNKEQIKERNRKYWYENKHRWVDSGRDGWLRRNYNITLKEYNELFNKQEGRCGLCGIHQSEQNRVMAVDHCHKTGIVRGLLCFECNVGLGKFKDDSSLLTKAVEYIKKYE